MVTAIIIILLCLAWMLLPYMVAMALVMVWLLAALSDTR